MEASKVEEAEESKVEEGEVVFEEERSCRRPPREASGEPGEPGFPPRFPRRGARERPGRGSEVRGSEVRGPRFLLWDGSEDPRSAGCPVNRAPAFEGGAGGWGGGGGVGRGA